MESRGAASTARVAHNPASPRLSLRANFSWIAAGRAVFAATQWGVLAVLAKVGTVEMVGLFTLGLAVSAPIFKLGNLGLRHAQATDVRGDHRFGDYLGLRVVTCVLALLATAGVAATLGIGAQGVAVILLIGTTRAVTALSEIYHGLFQARERMDHVARSLMLRGPIALAALALGVWVSGSLPLGVAGMLLAGIAILALYDAPFGARLLSEPGPDGSSELPGAALRPEWSPRVIGALAWRTLPLGIAGMLLALQLNIPRYFIAEQLGLEELGYFAAMVYVLVAANQFMMALGHSASARLARLYANAEVRRFGVLLLKMVGVGVAIGGVGLAAVSLGGGPLLALLYTPEYAQYADVFTLLMGAAIFRYVASLLNFGVTAARRFRIQVVHQSAVLLAALTGSVLLIEEFRLEGAALVTLLTFAVDLAGVVAINLWSIRKLRSAQKTLRDEPETR